MEIEVKLGPAWIPKIMVVSHERSGTHFLMNSLSLNFGYYAEGNTTDTDKLWLDLDMNLPINFWNPRNIMDFFNMLKGKPVLNIVKSHHPIEFFKPILRDIVEEFFIFYIYRDEKGVMDSCSRHYNIMEWDAGPKTENGVEYSLAIPCGGQLRYQKRQYINCRERWNEHVRGWINEVPLSLMNRIVYVKYHDLRDNFDQVIRDISSRIGIACPEYPVKPSKFENVVTPNIEEYNQLQSEV